MKNKSFTTCIDVALPAEDVFNHIKAIPKWWTTDFEGQSSNLNDEFTIRHGDVHYSKQKLIEVIPGKKLVWLVTDCRLNWIEKDKTEWTNTKMIFELTGDGDITTLKFTHEGLVPEKECYGRVAESWELVIKENLYNFIAKGEGNNI